TVASSALVKTAIYGRDANWGRVLCAVGYTPGVRGLVDPSRVSLSLWNPDGLTSFEEAHPLSLLEEGEPRLFDEEAASRILQEEDIGLTINLGDSGGKNATVWTCDLSHEYVSINGSYR
ncbi:MAG: arginine biosynthesis protein ArgJ, partial [Olpidium bornovanus]